MNGLFEARTFRFHVQGKTLAVVAARADWRGMTSRAALLFVVCALAAGSAGGARPNPREGRLSLASLRPERSQKSPPRASLADWMAEDAASLYARTLHEVTLPGTHDSGAYWLSKQTIPDARFPPQWAAAAIAAAERLGVPVDEIITAWALTQTADVGEQLRAGFRYLDLRAGWNGTAWCVHHAEVGVALSVVLDDLAAFVKRHRGEFVVAQVSHLDGAFSSAEKAKRVRELKASLTDALRGHLVPVAVTGVGALILNDTIGEMVARDERVLVVFGDGDYSDVFGDYSSGRANARDDDDASDADAFLWPPWTLHNGWADTDDPDALVRFATDETIAFNDKGGGGGGGSFGEPGSLFKLSWTLTAQTSTVLESVLPGEPKSLRELDAAGARPSLAPFAARVAKAGCRASNILSVDFAIASDAVRAARLMNAASADEPGKREDRCGLKSGDARGFVAATSE